MRPATECSQLSRIFDHPDTMNNYVAQNGSGDQRAQHLSGVIRIDAGCNQGLDSAVSFAVYSADVWHQISVTFARHNTISRQSPRLLNHLNLAWSRTEVATRTRGYRPYSVGGTWLPRDATQNVAFPRAGFPGYGPIENRRSAARVSEYRSTFSWILSEAVWSCGVKRPPDRDWHFSAASQLITLQVTICSLHGCRKRSRKKWSRYSDTRADRTMFR